MIGIIIGVIVLALIIAITFDIENSVPDDISQPVGGWDELTGKERKDNDN